MPDQRGGDEGLADVGAGRGDEDSAGIADAARQDALAHDRRPGRSISASGCCGGEGEAQPRGAGRHRRRPDRDRPESLRSSSSRDAVERRLGLADAPPARSGSAAPAARRGGRTRVPLRAAARHSPARARSRRAPRSPPRRSPAAGRSNRSKVRARLRIRSITGARGAEIAAIAAERLGQRAHLQRHVGLACRARRSSRGRRRPRRGHGRRRTSARRRGAARAPRAACSGARSPSMENTPSVAIRRAGGAARCSASSASTMRRRRCGGRRRPSRATAARRAHRQACASSSIRTRSSRADQRRDDAGIGEIAGAEHAGRLGSLQPRQPRFELGEQRMVAGDQARGAGARRRSVRAPRWPRP